MAPRALPLVTLLFAALAASLAAAQCPDAYGFCPPNISSSEYNCTHPDQLAADRGEQVRTVHVRFNGSLPRDCGAEIRKAWCEDTAIQVFFWSKAALSKLYTLIVVDPDAPNSPLFPPGPFASPIRHWLVGNIPGKALKNKGFSLAHNASATFYAPVFGCSPGANSGCHRYQVMLFVQAAKLAPTYNQTKYSWGAPSENAFEGDPWLTNFDFPLFATDHKLTRVAINTYQSKDANQTLTGVKHCARA